MPLERTITIRLKNPTPSEISWAFGHSDTPKPAPPLIAAIEAAETEHLLCQEDGTHTASSKAPSGVREFASPGNRRNPARPSKSS